MTSGSSGTEGERAAERCLSLTVAGPWGHFRRVDGNTIKATYRLPPRTTVAGLLAAIAGYERDSYYGVFDRAESGIAIQPVAADADGSADGERPIRTMNLPENSLTTSNEGMKAVNARGKVSVRYPDPDHDRQRVNYEVLVDPAYRIDLWLNDGDAYERLRSRLADGRAEYVPSLGLSEFLASITFHGEFDVGVADAGTDGQVTVDSAVPAPDGIVPDPERPHATERSPGDMTRTSETGEFTGRKTTEFLRWGFTRDGGPLVATDVNAATVDGRTVVFS